MDDEDLAELRESQQLVDENEEMDFGGTEAELRRKAGTSEEEECASIFIRVYLQHLDGSVLLALWPVLWLRRSLPPHKTQSAHAYCERWAGVSVRASAPG